jgi:hypothetical protein
MRFGKLFIVCGIIIAVVAVGIGYSEAAQRRLAVQRYQAARQGTVTKSVTSASGQNRSLITEKIFQLSPMIIPANGPSGAQGVGAIFYNDVDTSLNTGNLVVTGLPAGSYYVWLVFFDPLASKAVYSELVAHFTVNENSARTETALTIGLPNVVNISTVKQIVVTYQFKTNALVGGKPVNGAAGHKWGPGYGAAVLAANMN